MGQQRWIRKWERDAATDGFLRLPTRVVSHEEYVPPPDDVSRLKAAYLDEGTRPSLTRYGWGLGR